MAAQGSSRGQAGPPEPSVTLLDGATGTELSRRGADTRLPLWSARPLVTDPDLVRRVHADWLLAGAEILTTCTFRTHRRSLAHGGWEHRVDELNQVAVDLARQARDEASGVREVRIAGGIAPLEDCYRPDLVPDDDVLAEEHGAQAESLARAGAELLLVETMACRREAVAAVTAARATGLPSWCSLCTTGDGRLLSGEPLAEVAEEVAALGVEAVLLNCLPSVDLLPDLERLRAAVAGPVGAYGNVGHAHDVDGWRVELQLTPEHFAELAESWLAAGASLVGGCCGTEPRHVAELARRQRRNVRSAR
ncbi:MAG: homocysteine S-methyltransferase family protein [Acidobacteriota bacterium]